MAKTFERDGTQYLAGLLRERYLDKATSFRDYLVKTKIARGLDPFLLKIFGESQFSGTAISKADFVSELLHDELKIDSWLFIRERLRELAYLTDRRHTEEYAFDVCLGWVVEEMFTRVIRDQSGDENAVELVGIDSDREIQPLNIRAKADFKVVKMDEEVLVDLSVDYFGTWEKNGWMDLKPGKIGHFLSGDLDYVLGFDVKHQKLYLVGPKDIEGIEAVPNTAMGGINTVRVPIYNPIALSDLWDSLWSHG